MLYPDPKARHARPQERNLSTIYPGPIEAYPDANQLDLTTQRDSIPGSEWPASADRPPKTFIQRNRLRVRSLLLLLVPALLIVTDRTLANTAIGYGLYALGSLAILAAVVGRFWCYVYNSGTRTKIVITQGPYSLCRNPIYLCSIGVAAGIGLLSQSIVLAILFAASAMLFYAHIINGEEKKLMALHGSVYSEYLEKTSKYLPRFDRLSPGIVKDVPGQILMRKIPKLISLGLIFPLIEICSRLRELIGISIWETF